MTKKLKIDLTKIKGKYGFRYSHKFKSIFGTTGVVYWIGSAADEYDSTGYEIAVSFEPKTQSLYFNTVVYNSNDPEGDILERKKAKIVKVHSQREAENAIHTYMASEVYD